MPGDGSVDEEGGVPRREGILDTIDSLVDHMNSSRRVYAVLIVAAFVTAPVLIAFGVAVLVPDIATEVGRDLTIDVEIEGAPVGYSAHGRGAHDVFGRLNGTLDGRMVGHEVGGGGAPGAASVYYGEFAGLFNGIRGAMFGEFVGTFTGEAEMLHPGGPGAAGAGGPGMYSGEFAGTFTGSFAPAGAGGAEALAGMVEQGGPAPGAPDPAGAPSMAYNVLDAGGLGPAGAVEYDVSFVPTDEAHEGEYAPRFVAFEFDGEFERHTDITEIIVAMIATMCAVAAVVLYVGIREFVFYSNWTPRFKRYVERREAVDRDLGG